MNSSKNIYQNVSKKTQVKETQALATEWFKRMHKAAETAASTLNCHNHTFPLEIADPSVVIARAMYRKRNP